MHKPMFFLNGSGTDDNKLRITCSKKIQHVAPKSYLERYKGLPSNQRYRDRCSRKISAGVYECISKGLMSGQTS